MKRKPVHGYICGTDWDTEIPWAPTVDLPIVYRSQAALKRERSCWRECGIVEVKVSYVRTVRKPRMKAFSLKDIPVSKLSLETDKAGGGDE